MHHNITDISEKSAHHNTNGSNEARKMSQEYNGKGKAVGGGGESSRRQPSGRPQYVTVGSGSTSESAARLQALLDNDSGYGGSVAGDALNGVPTWNPALTEDRPTPSHSPMPRGPGEAADNDRRIQANAIHQLWYNHTELLWEDQLTELWRH